MYDGILYLKVVFLYFILNKDEDLDKELQKFYQRSHIANSNLCNAVNKMFDKILIHILKYEIEKPSTIRENNLQTNWSWYMMSIP